MHRVLGIEQLQHLNSQPPYINFTLVKRVTTPHILID